MNRKVLFTPNEIEQFFENFNNEVFSFDTETTSLVYSEIKLEGISFCDGDNNAYIVLQGRDSKGNILFKNEFKKSIIDYLRGIFKKAKILIGHNIVYDLKVMHKYGIPFEHCELYCTMIADHLLDETRPHGLKDLAKQFLGVEITEYSNATFTSKFFEYAMNDALWTWQLCTLQKPLLQEQGLLKLFRDIEMPFQKVLVDMAVNGITVDKERVEKTTKEVKQKVEDLTVQMLEHIKEPYSMQVTLTGDSNVISKINFNSPAQLSDLLFTRLGLDVVERTPSGQPSVGRKTIAIYKKHPFVELLNKYKIASKLLHAFFEPMLDFVEADGKVRPSFKDTGTVTGRLSCSKPNLQQLPKVNKDMPIDTRQCFVADRGYKMVTCDFSGQELRVLTQITQEPVLIDTFNSGKDMHLATANDFFDLGIPEECLYTYNDKFDMYKDKFKNERDKAKIVNFGMAYGKGAYGFSQDFGISEEEAQKILDKYFAALPAVKKAIEECHNQVRKTGYVTSLTGRRRRFNAKEFNGNKFYPNSAFRQSFNFLIQGFSADMIRIAMTKVREMAKNYPQWGLKTIFTVHDEAGYLIKENYVNEASEKIKETFENAVNFCIPVIADIGIGDDYSESK